MHDAIKDVLHDVQLETTSVESVCEAETREPIRTWKTRQLALKDIIVHVSSDQLSKTERKRVAKQEQQIDGLKQQVDELKQQVKDQDHKLKQQVKDQDRRHKQTEQYLARAFLSTVLNASCQFLMCAAGEDPKHSGSNRFKKLGANNGGVKAVAKAFDMDPGGFIKDADNLINRWNRATHPMDLSDLSMMVTEAQKLITPEMRALPGGLPCRIAGVMRS
ncbi:hypothetical protein GPECTOR_91g577 [Gonium pectorale]|uniref:Uncharacterized protein n=1 Tax=Gonium pectorale TaxID=33097 RepID=A0A150G0L1_GONPE|nr:hypothetical protein GPECTOR_91g577 [Gonium pectorale]|eukprot:KXZ43423.1 hypothetical protein GPECTOR_91g577 [Gonium pectorale]